LELKIRKKMAESCREDENVSHSERYLVYKAWRDVVKIGKCGW
jgi:hypothetical protein